MSSRLVLSLAAFSLIGHLAADGAIQEELFEEVVVEEKEPEQKVQAKAPETPEQELLRKKLKPQYAGARRAPPKEPAKEGEKKKTHVKNKWFSSKTQPKAEKKNEHDAEIVTTELPADRPRYIKTSSLPLASESNPPSPPVCRPPREEVQQNAYPRSGFQAPSGTVYFTGEWLYWRARQEGMEFATAKKVDFDFQSGFRVGMGVHLPIDFWDIYVDYTQFNPDASESAHGGTYPLFLFQGAGSPSGTLVSEAHAHWKVQFQNVDIQIGRAFYIAKTLVLRPFFGLKGAWIDQHANFRYEGGFIPAGETFRTHLKNDFKGAGPLIGVETNWMIGEGFSLFGDFSSALIAGHFHDKQKQYQLGGAEVVDLDSDFNLVNPMVQLVTGLAWDRNFNRDRWHVGISAGFETQYWWAQNQTEQFTDETLPIYVRNQGDLGFYGLTLRARMDF